MQRNSSTWYNLFAFSDENNTLRWTLGALHWSMLQFGTVSGAPRTFLRSVRYVPVGTRNWSIVCVSRWLVAFIRFLPSLFKYLSASYILSHLFASLFDLLSSSISNKPYAKIFCSKCGSVADERSVVIDAKSADLSLCFLPLAVWVLSRISTRPIYSTRQLGNRMK